MKFWKIEFWRPKPGTFVVHDGRRGYVSWLSQVIGRLDKSETFHKEKRLIVGYASTGNMDQIMYVGDKGLVKEHISSAEDIDLMLIRRPVIMACFVLVIGTAVVVSDLLRKIR